MTNSLISYCISFNLVCFSVWIDFASEISVINRRTNTKKRNNSQGKVGYTYSVLKYNWPLVGLPMQRDFAKMIENRTFCWLLPLVVFSSKHYIKIRGGMFLKVRLYPAGFILYQCTPGVFFINLYFKEMFNADYGMFILDSESQTFWFNPTSYESDAQFTLVGIILGD